MPIEVEGEIVVIGDMNRILDFNLDKRRKGNLCKHFFQYMNKLASTDA